MYANNRRVEVSCVQKLWNMFSAKTTYKTFDEAEDLEPQPNRSGQDVTEAPPMKSDEDVELNQKQHQMPMVVLSERPAYTQSSFQEAFQYVEDQKQECCPTSCECMLKLSPNCVWSFIKARIPMLEWIEYYNFRNNIASDIIAGIIVGVMHIPQGMAYAVLGDVPTVLGLYVSFFPVLIYFFLGTSRHVSVGTFAIICLMLGKIVNTYKGTTLVIDDDSSQISYNNSFINATDSGCFNGTEPCISTSSSPPIIVGAEDIAVAVCLVAGIIHILMGILRLGSLSMLLSETLVSGFTTGASFHVFTSQVKHLFGLSIEVAPGYVSIFRTYIEIFKQIHQSNYITVIISAMAIITLVLVNECINARFRGKMKMPVPIELIIIVIVTTVSYFIQLSEESHVDIVGVIPTGLPQPRVPHMELVLKVAVDTIALAVVAFSISLSMGMIFAKKHKYEISANQELFALGVCNVFSSFFSCFPCCVSLSRSMVQETAGSKSQVSSLISCIIVLIVLLFIGPLFRSLPRCILASIIVVALKGMFLQIRDLRQAWRVSPLEGLVWLVSFLAVLLTDVDIGLGIGVLFSLFTVIFRTLNCQIFKLSIALPHTFLLGRVVDTDIYVDVSKYKEAKEIPGVKIFHFSGPLYFANRFFFKSTLYEMVGVNPRFVTTSMQRREVLKKKEKDSKLKEVKKQRKEMERREHMESEGNAKIVNYGEAFEQESDTDAVDKIIAGSNGDLTTALSIVPVHHIIMDCSGWTYIDSSGMSTLIQVIQEYQEVSITVYLAACQIPLLELFDKINIHEKVPTCAFFPTIHDAVHYACQGKTLSLNYGSSTSSESNF